MGLGETLTHFGLEDVFLCGSVLCRLCATNAFRGKHGFHVDTSHFPFGVLAAVTLIVDVGWRWRSKKTGHGVRWEFLSA